eukprot:jgi/Pico_ML_1/51745/g309.t1
MMKRLAGSESALVEAAVSYAYVTLWISFSAGVILFNKWLLAFKGFPFPIALTMFHMGFCTILASVAINAFRWVDPVDTINREVYVKRIVPIGGLYAASLWFCNSAYIYLSVSFIQMLKALMPVIVYSIGVAAKLEGFDSTKMANMAVISIGVAVASYGELNFNLTGVIMQLMGLVAEASRLVLVQILLTSKGLKLNPITSIYYISPCSFVFLILPFIFVELGPMLQTMKMQGVSVDPVLMVENGLVAFGLNIAVFLLIGKTSALTLNIAGVLKDWLLIGLSSWIFGAPVTPLNLEGYTIAFAAVCYYNHSKLRSLKADTRKQSTHDVERGGTFEKSSATGNGNGFQIVRQDESSAE